MHCKIIIEIYVLRFLTHCPQASNGALQSKPSSQSPQISDLLDPHDSPSFFNPGKSRIRNIISNLNPTIIQNHGIYPDVRNINRPVLKAESIQRSDLMSKLHVPWESQKPAMSPSRHLSPHCLPPHP